MNCRRNRISLDSFTVLSWGFVPPLIFHLGLLYRCLVSFVLVSPPHFLPLPSSFSSVFCPYDTCWVFIQVTTSSVFLFLIVLTRYFLPSTLDFFYSTTNKREREAQNSEGAKRAGGEARTDETREEVEWTEVEGNGDPPWDPHYQSVA